MVRLNAHNNQLKRGIHTNRDMQSDFNTYGPENFQFSRLVIGHGITDAEERRRLETKILERLPPENRYNAFTNWRTRTGEANPFYGRTHSFEAWEALRQARLGKPSNFTGKTQSDDARKKVSNHNKGKSNIELRKSVLIEGILYESVTHASKVLNLTRNTIRHRCNSTKEI